MKTLFLNCKEHVVEDYSNALVEGQQLPVYGTYVATHVVQLANKRVGRITKRDNLTLLEELYQRSIE